MQSFWKEEIKNHKEFEKLNKDIEVSVCIIGGGLTGLSTAYYLCKKTSVAIIEKDRICNLSSGANTGKITSQHGLFYDYLIQSKGKEYAKSYLEANEKAIKNIEEIIKKEKIKCDFKKEKAYVFTQDESKVKKIKKESAEVNRLYNGKSDFIKKLELPIEIKGAIVFNEQAQFHPVKYAYGLVDTIIKNNGQIYENTKVYDVKKQGDKYEIVTDNYKITANYVVIATRYPIINTPGFHFLKMYQSSSFAILADTKTELFDGMYISDDQPTISFRTVDYENKRLLLAVGYDYKTGKCDDKDGYGLLETRIKDMCPEAEIVYKWKAEDCISLDKIPYIGKFSSITPNVYMASGFNKWGITSSNIAANIIADEILGNENEYKDTFMSTRLEPIKNRVELGNMIKEASESLVLSKFKLPANVIESIKPGDGKVVDLNGKKIGVYKDENEEIYTVNPICTHLGCELCFNNIDKIWECPCHGSKFTYDGKSIETPSVKDLKKISIDEKD